MDNAVVIKLLGCGNAFADGGRFNTCFYVQSPHYNFFIDCGASSIVAIRKFNIDLAKIDAIVLTHLHGDHAGGVSFVEMARQGANPKKSLKIIGPTGTTSAIHAALKLFFPEAGSSNSEFIEYDAGTTVVDALEIVAYQAVHVKETHPYSLRITFHDKVIAFSGDTEWYDELISLADAADLFICECTSVQHAKNHMNYEKLKMYHQTIRAKKVLLTHMDESMLNMRDCIFEKAYDGQEIIL